MESKLLVQDREIAVPGEVLAEGMEYLPSQGTYRHGENIRANILGLVRVEGKVLKLIPLAGRYAPKVNDIVVAQVDDILMSGWRFNINCAYAAVLPLKDAGAQFIEKGEDLTQYFALGDWVACKISNVTSQKLVDVTMRGPGLKKLAGGRTFTVNSQKVPRIIGKEGSMLSMIRSATGCRLVVGQNGAVWLSGVPEYEYVAVQAIRMIEQKSHVSGLTEQVKAFLDEQLKNLPPPPPIVEEPQQEFVRRDFPPREGRDFHSGGFRRGGGGFHRGPPRFRGPPRGE